VEDNRDKCIERLKLADSLGIFDNPSTFAVIFESPVFRSLIDTPEFREWKQVVLKQGASQKSEVSPEK
jgi:hypothetical protein